MHAYAMSISGRAIKTGGYASIPDKNKRERILLYYDPLRHFSLHLFWFGTTHGHIVLARQLFAAFSLTHVLSKYETQVNVFFNTFNHFSWSISSLSSDGTGSIIIHLLLSLSRCATSRPIVESFSKYLNLVNYFLDTNYISLWCSLKACLFFFFSFQLKVFFSTARYNFFQCKLLQVVRVALNVCSDRIKLRFISLPRLFYSPAFPGCLSYFGTFPRQFIHSRREQVLTVNKSIARN